jgi:hypothetical protein
VSDAPKASPVAPNILKLSCLAAWAVSVVCIGVGVVLLARERQLSPVATPSLAGQPEYLNLILAGFGLVLGLSTVQVWRGAGWGAFVPIGCLVAIAATWVRMGVGVAPIVASLALAGALALVWVLPRSARAFYSAAEAGVDAPQSPT